MKQFVNMILNDYRAEGFTRKEYIIYGIIAPVIFVILTAIV
jgi:hypothetical protein